MNAFACTGMKLRLGGEIDMSVMNLARAGMNAFMTRSKRQAPGFGVPRIRHILEHSAHDVTFGQDGRPGRPLFLPGRMTVCNDGAQRFRHGARP